MDIGPDGGREHRYRFTLEWTGNQGSGTSNYRAYGRDHDRARTGQARPTRLV